MKKIKVMHTIRQGSIGGGETYLYNLVTNMNKDIYEPVVLSFTDGEMITKLKNAGIKTHVINTEKPFSLQLYPKIYKLMKNEEINLLHIHGTRAATNSLFPSKFMSIPSVYTVHGWSFHTGNNPLVTKMRSVTEKVIVKSATKTVCGSEADKSTGESLNPSGEFELIHNSISSEEYNPAKVNSDFRAKNGYSKDDFIIGFIGRITFQKDPQTFIKAIPEVLEKKPDAKFVIVGNGELKNECVELARALGVAASIKFLPFSTNVKEVLKAVDVFLLPSLWEVIPLALLEAMSMEKFCIATNIPGTTEAIVNGKNGLLFEVGDYHTLANHIIDAEANKVKMHELSKEARNTVVSKFDLKKLVRKNEDLYSQLLDKKNV